MQHLVARNANIRPKNEEIPQEEFIQRRSEKSVEINKKRVNR